MDEIEVCKNCRREIPSVNYVMHLAHCLRNTETCSECGETVLVAQIEEHKRENHRTVKCGLCGQEVIRAKLDCHMENSCLEKLVECSFCAIQVPFRKLNDHEIYCGSRTDPCEKCDKYIMIKDLAKHVCAASKSPQKTVTIPCEFCEQQVELHEFERHQAICPEVPNENDDDVETLDDSTPIESHQTQDSSQHENITDEEFTDGTGEEYNSIYALPCEFCNELCPSDKLYEHQEQCQENKEINGDDTGTRHENLTSRTHHAEPNHFDRQNPFDTIYHPFLLGFLDSMAKHPHRPHFRIYMHHRS